MNPNQHLTWPGSLLRPLDEAQHALEDLGAAVGPIRRALEQTIADHPIKAVVLSLASGVFLGWLIKR
jgi:hypothetical protein